MHSYSSAPLVGLNGLALNVSADCRASTSITGSPSSPGELWSVSDTAHPTRHAEIANKVVGRIAHAPLHGTFQLGTSRDRTVETRRAPLTVDTAHGQWHPRICATAIDYFAAIVAPSTSTA